MNERYKSKIHRREILDALLLNLIFQISFSKETSEVQYVLCVYPALQLNQSLSLNIVTTSPSDTST